MWFQSEKIRLMYTKNARGMFLQRSLKERKSESVHGPQGSFIAHHAAQGERKDIIFEQEEICASCLAGTRNEKKDASAR